MVVHAAGAAHAVTHPQLVGCVAEERLLECGHGLATRLLDGVDGGVVETRQLPLHLLAVRLLRSEE